MWSMANELLIVMNEKMLVSVKPTSTNALSVLIIICFPNDRNSSDDTLHVGVREKSVY